MHAINRFGATFTKWHRDTVVAIENIFVSDVAHFRDFKTIVYMPLYSGATENEKERKYHEDLERAEAVLDSFIQEIQKYWPDEEAPNTPDSYGGVILLNQAYSALRAILENNFSFYHIKEIVGLAGLDLTLVAHLEQKLGGGASKGQLMTGIDNILKTFDEGPKKRYVAIVAEEVLKRRPETREPLSNYLERLGWTLSGDAVIPIALLDNSSLSDLPPESQKDLSKAAQRLRDGDLSGAISAACGALDSATSRIYATAGLGDPTLDSFQGRCKRALEALEVIRKLEQQLNELGWSEKDIKPFRENLKGALNQSAYIMQSLRSKMSDVHGTKPILKPLIFDSLKWAELILRLLNED